MVKEMFVAFCNLCNESDPLGWLCRGDRDGEDWRQEEKRIGEEGGLA
jgi:hypothetical protein